MAETSTVKREVCALHVAFTKARSDAKMMVDDARNACIVYCEEALTNAKTAREAFDAIRLFRCGWMSDDMWLLVKEWVGKTQNLSEAKMLCHAVHHGVGRYYYCRKEIMELVDDRVYKFVVPLLDRPGTDLIGLAAHMPRRGARDACNSIWERLFQDCQSVAEVQKMRQDAEKALRSARGHGYFSPARSSLGATVSLAFYRLQNP